MNDQRCAQQTLKALSLWQPWASLVAEGIKCVETRGWATSYRGPLAIAASASIPTDVRHRVLGHRIRGRYNSYGQGDAQIQNALYAAGYEDGGVADGKPLPLGCVVATCTLVDVVPTEDVYWTGLWPRWAWQGHAGSPVYPPQVDPRVHELHVVVPEKERPYGDYTPGRFAWLLADIEKVDPPVPATGKQGLWTWNRGGSNSHD